MKNLLRGLSDQVQEWNRVSGDTVLGRYTNSLVELLSLYRGVGIRGKQLGRVIHLVVVHGQENRGAFSFYL